MNKYAPSMPKLNDMRIASPEHRQGIATSILQDLDPKNAKIPSRTWAERRHRAAWGLAALIVALGGLWLFFAQTIEKPQRPLTTAQQDPTTPAQRPTAGEKRFSSSTTTQVDGPPSNTAKETATIRITPPASDARQAAEREIAPRDAKDQKTAVTPQKKSSPTGTKSASGAKPLNTKGKKPESEIRSTQHTQKAAERDIDIITAIVK